MPTARFLADFTAFDTAVERSTLKLREFGTAPEKVEKSLSRMVDNFSGRKLIEEATLAAEAVKRIEESGALTGDELRKVSTLAAQAAEKLRLMGKDVPESLSTLAARLDPIPQKLSLIEKAGAALSSTLGQVAAGFTLGAIVDRGISGLSTFAREAFAAGDQISDLAKQTKLSTDEIQRMQHVADQTGAELTDFTGAAFELTKRIGIGKSGLREAVSDLGLDLGTLRQAQPEALFETMVRALSGVESATEQARLGNALFGDNFKALVPAIEEGYGKIADAASIASHDQIAALAEASDAWSHFVTRTKTATTSFLGETILFFQHATKTIAQNPALLLTPNALIPEILSSRVGGSVEAQQAAAAREAAAATGALSNVMVDYVGRLRDAKDAAGDLTREQQAQIKAALELGRGVQDLADEYGTSVEAIRLFVEQLKTQDQLMGRPIIDKAEGLLEALEALRAQGLAPARSEFAGIVDSMIAAQKVMESTGRAAEAMYSQMEAARRRFSGLTAEGLIPSTHLGVPLAQAPGIEQDLQMQTDLQNAHDEANRVLAEQIQQQNELSQALDDTAQAHTEANEAAVEGADKAAKGYGRLTGQILEASAALKIMIPLGTSWTQAYKDAGFFVDEAGGAMRPSYTQTRQRAATSSGVVVSVNASGAFFDSPESIERLADKVGSALNKRTRSTI
jgi:hypothetical protein